jgi:predicted Fe-S protein YdhL (DUF1289 family)
MGDPQGALRAAARLSSTMDSVPAATWLASPCVGVCRLDPDTGWCMGCGRSGAELEVWRGLDAESRNRVWRDLPRRKAVLGVGFRLLPWAASALMLRLAHLAAEPGARWSVGVWGAVAELMPTPGDSMAVEAADSVLTLRARGGRLRLLGHPGLRAFQLVGGGGRAQRIVLALHRSRLPPPFFGIAELGPDRDAIEPAARGHRLFDLGLGLAPVRFCVRTGVDAVIFALRRHAGRSLLTHRNDLLPALLAASPDRVVASPIARLEIEGQILRHGDAGPHTHLLPELLAQNRELEPGCELPPAYAPCASLYLAGCG